MVTRMVCCLLLLSLLNSLGLGHVATNAESKLRLGLDGETPVAALAGSGALEGKIFEPTFFVSEGIEGRAPVFHGSSESRGVPLKMFFHSDPWILKGLASGVSCHLRAANRNRPQAPKCRCAGVAKATILSSSPYKSAPLPGRGRMK